MDKQTDKASLQEEIKALEERLKTLPDSLVEERIEIRKKLIALYTQNGQ